jgi:hypothetical protein
MDDNLNAMSIKIAVAVKDAIDEEQKSEMRFSEAHAPTPQGSTTIVMH